MASEAQIIANKQNAQFSRGPVTAAGKEVSAKNAIKFALTGKTILLPEDNVAEYEKLGAIIFDKYRPETDAEKLIVQDVADTEWRLLRVPRIESAIFSLGHLENQQAYDQIDPGSQKTILVEGAIYQTHQTTLANLSLQQNRLQRHLERKTAEFKELRKEREIVQTVRRNMVMRSIMGESTTPDPSIGFEFSREYLKARVEFCHYAKGADVTLFDRTWRDKKAKTPA